MSISCPNKRLKVWKDLVQNVGKNKAYVLWAEYDGNVPDNYYQNLNTSENLEKTRDESVIFMKKDLSELTTNNETNIFEDINQKIENLENSQNDNHLSENNEMLFQSEPKLKLKASEVLNNILQSTQIDKFKESAFFLEKVLNLLNKSNATFKVISDEQFNILSKNNTQTVMLFDSKTNEILVSRSILENNSPEFIAESFIHEVVHSITVKAYFDPQTREEHQFKEFIDKSYAQYKYLSEELDEKGNQMYGFTNQAEFIAEIYSNPKFRNKIEELEKGWLKRLLDNVRRLFGLAKNSLNEKLISSTLLFETVDNFINTVDQNNQGVYSKWKGTIFRNPKYEIFSKQSEIKTELKTIQDKLDYNIQRINESLKINIDKYKYLNKVFKDNKAIQAYLTTLETLKSEINTFQDANKIKGVVLFLEEMGRSLAFVENKLDNIDYSNSEDIKNTARIYDSYLTTFSVIEDVKSLLSVISEDSSQTLLNKEELNKLNELFDIRYGKYNRLNERFNEVKKEVVKNQINNIKYFPNIEKKHRDRLSLEHKNNQIPQDKETWIIDKMLNRDKDLIQEDLDKEVLNFLNNPSIDIYASDVTFSSAINVSSPMIQIMYQLLNEIENKRLFEERSKDIEFRRLFEKLVKEKGSNNVNEIYKNILDVSKSGKQYLLSEYKSEFYEEVYLKIKNLKREAYNKILENKLKMTSLSENNQINSQEYKDLLEENKKIEKDLETNVKQLENENLILDEKGKILGIKDKWKNDFSKLSETEKEVLNFFKSISQEAHKDTFGKKSLIKFLYKQNDSQNKFEKYVTFYELPKVTKSSTERLWSGDIKGNLQDKWTDLTSLKPDDVGFASVETDMSGKPIHNLKIHYRSNNFDPKNQSLDLMNVYRLEYKNGNAFKHRKESELDLNFLLDVAKSKKYYENKGTNQVLNTRNKKLNLIEGENSQTLKMMQNMMESKLYDILNKTGTKIGNVEATKAVGAITSFSSFMSLAFNIASGTANVVNANAQLFLESFIKGLHIKAESIKKAEEIYFKDFKGNISDVTNGLHTSFTNQVLEMFNVKGEFLFSNSNFLKSNIVKKGINLETTQMFQTSGEHWIQSIITFSVLDGIKVMNHNHKFIDKSGNVVENEKDAASLLDMLEKNEDDLITFNKNVVYTTHSRLTPLNEGGKEKIDSLIIKKIHDSAGNYRTTDQSELYRHWWGKLFGQYKKYLVPMGQSRLRGIETAFTSKKDLTDDQKRFSYALQEYEEGTYTTLVRYLYSSLKNGQRFVQLKENWNEMSDYEKHNIKRAITEIIITSVILPLLITLIAGAAGDDDNELLFFTAYQLRRLDTELSAYRSISESFKMMRSPIPSARILEHSLQTLTTIINPFEWDELIEKDSKGYNKFLKKQQKQIPVVRDFIKSYEDLYEFQNSSWGTSL